MLNAGFDCQAYGNQQSCAYYQQAYRELEVFYTQALQTAQQANVGVAQGYSQAAHLQRMQEIHDFGVANTQAFNQRMQAMDLQHQQFIDMIRE